MTALLCSVRALSVCYRAGKGDGLALRGVDLDIVAGERLAIIGESGSGKTTFGRTLAGLLPAGAVAGGTVDWPAFRAWPTPGRDLGVVFQDPGSSLNPVMTIGEQVAEGARRHLGLSWPRAFERAQALLTRVRLPQPEAMLRAFPHQLSGGQRQRVAIAAAIAARPKVLIADEVTSALDMVVQADIVVLLQTLVQEEGMTLIFITHDMALASGLADRIAVFRDGKLVELGPSASVLGRPRDAYTAELIAANMDLKTPRLVVDAQA